MKMHFQCQMSVAQLETHAKFVRDDLEFEPYKIHSWEGVMSFKCNQIPTND